MEIKRNEGSRGRNSLVIPEFDKHRKLKSNLLPILSCKSNKFTLLWKQVLKTKRNKKGKEFEKWFGSSVTHCECNWQINIELTKTLCVALVAFQVVSFSKSGTIRYVCFYRLSFS